MADSGELNISLVLRDSLRLILYRPLFCLLVVTLGFIFPGIVLDLWIVGGGTWSGPFDPLPDAEWTRLYIWLTHQLLTSLPVLVFTLAMPDPETGSISTNAEMLDQTFRKLPVIGAIAVIATGLTILGFLAMILPGIVLSILLYVAIPAAMLEKGTPFAALRRSVALVRLAFWKTSAVILLVKAMEVLILQMILKPREIFGESETMDIGPSAWGWFGTGMVGIIGFILPAVLYYHLKLIERHRRSL